jgi:hypothetical protein
MKAASLLRQFWAACFVCGILVAASGIAFANASNNGTKGTADCTIKKEVEFQQQDPVVKKKEQPEAVAMPLPQQENPAQKVDNKTPEVKKENVSAPTSFSFLFYLFYKGNIAETTNNAIKVSLSNLVNRLLD